MPHSLRTLLVDDEAPARKQMRFLLKAHPELVVIGEAESVATALQEAARLLPEVIFLDVQMPGSDGFDLLAQLKPLPRVVFVSAHDHFAVRAFEVSALDYLVKPVHPRRLAATVQRLLHPPETATVPTVEGAERLEPGALTMLRDGRKVRMTAISQVVWIEAEGIYSRVGLAEGGYTRALRSLGEWEAILPTPLFARVERSLIVNLGKIVRLEGRNRNRSTLTFRPPALPLEIGRTASANLRRELARFGIA